jgi:hypothetical protein
MNKKQRTIASLPLDQTAQDRAKEHIDRFTDNLVFQSKLTAYRKGYDSVLPPHIDEAMDIISSQQQRAWFKDFMVLIGGSLFGASVPGIASEITVRAQDQNHLLLVFFIICAVVGSCSSLFGLLLRKN